MFRFLYPWFLVTLAIPILIGILQYRLKRIPFLKFPYFSQVPSLLKPLGSYLMMINSTLLYLAMICFIIALARPQWGRAETEVTSEGIDIILTLDTSGSMAAMDFKLEGEPVNRLTVVKKVITDFIKEQTGDRLGMIVFGDEAYTQCPLTLDYDVLIQLLDHVTVGIAGDSTAIGDGLALSIKRLKDLPGKSKVIILLTDGRSNAGKINPEKAAEIAKTFGIRIYTIGIGTKGPVPFPQPSVFGTRLVYVNLDMDEDTLQKIAQTTGGKFFSATDTQKLEAIYKEIGKLEKTKAQVKHYELYYEWFIYFATAALGFLVLEIFLSTTLLRRLV